MRTHAREKKVLVILGISITLGAAILNALGHNPPSAGAFCLSRYYRLGPVKKAILSRADQSTRRWIQIEVCYSGTESGNIEQLALLSGVDGPEDVNYHFIICNGNGGKDGQIQSTEKWQRQSSIIPGQSRNDDAVFCSALTAQTIYICVIADNENSLPTDFQVKRTEELVEALCRKFNIQPESISYVDSRQ
ncbi:MAG: hypothetical protein RQ760_08870 [Sedimentisphaerales bacterium]|nr:hypothetical protein [Sedimentisphaerales bacterium]